MIIAHVIGGLGNQMFQYAAAKALSIKKNTPLLLDISSFNSYTLHQGFELNALFSGEFSIARDSDVRQVLGWQSPQTIRNILHRPQFAWLRKDSLAIEPSFQYWEDLDDSPDDSYMTGYWQSERYFEKAKETIRKEFNFKTPLSAENSEIADRIQKTDAVSLHVRRGDYLNNSAYASCSINYYQSAIKHLLKYVKTPTFYVFSDDIDWVKRNLTLDQPHFYIEHNKGVESYNDMRLMSLCKHNIIANSSFSWWGAWLNANTDKIVVAPKRWFTNDTDLKDLFPSSWVIL